MNSSHHSWNAGLLENLDQVQLVVKRDHKEVIEQIGDSLKKFGFSLVRGIENSGKRDLTASKLLSLSADLGKIIPQSPRNQKIEDIRDFSDVDVKDERGYRSRGELSPHSDPPTLILLHCLQAAKNGGESYLVNVRSIHDAIGKGHPELLDVLYQGFPHWQVEGQLGGPGPAPHCRPIFMLQNGQVSCTHYRPFLEKAVQALNTPLTSQQIKALDLFDQYANAAEFALRFYLEPGQTLILHNRTVLHARTDYEDWEDPAKRRHLLRVWIDAPGLLPVSTEHELGDIFSDT